MKTLKRRKDAAYNKAIYAELQRRGQSPKDALQAFHRYYRPLRQTWGYELNPETFADEIIKLQKLVINPTAEKKVAINGPASKKVTVTVSTRKPAAVPAGLNVKE